jgi:nitroreductase
MPDPYETLLSVLQARWSCRAFLPDPMDGTDISRIVQAARHVPSWCNAQPWQLEITRGAETDRFRAALFAQAENNTPQPDLDWPTGYSGLYKDRRRACGYQLYDAVGVEKSDREGTARQMMQNYALFGAPHVAILHSPSELGAYGAMDCGGFVTAFTLAAQSLGIATIPQAAVAAFGGFLHDYFDIADDRLVLCAISFGYPDTSHPANGFRTARADVPDIVRWHG